MAAPRTEEAPHEAPGANFADHRLLQVGELAAAVGKTVRAIHHYEELGLIEPDARSKGRFRLYDQQAVKRVRWISKLHDLGLSLTQIQDIVSTWEHAPTAGRAAATVRAIYSEKLDETRRQIEHLQDLQRELQASIAYLDACEPCDVTGVRRVHEEPTNVRRLPVVENAFDHASFKETRLKEAALKETGLREVGSCVTCETRERDQEPELVAGLLSRTKKIESPTQP